MNNKKMFSLIFTFLFISLFCLVNVEAYSTQKMVGGQKVCVDTNAFSQYYLYTWKKRYGNDTWPGNLMTKETDSNVRCFILRTDEEEKYEHDSLIFNNNQGAQTIDLSYVGDGLVYVFDNNSEKQGDKFVGKWYVYNKSTLVNLVNEVSGYKATDYTIASYEPFLQAFNVANPISKETYKVYDENNNFVEYNKNFLLHDKTGGGYYSIYKNAYNDLLTAKNNLDSRNIVVESAIGGSVSYKYEENSNTKMKFVSTEEPGYELSSLKILNNEGVELKDLINDSDPFTYEYNDENLVITPSYKLKQFVINFTVGKDGKIYDLEDGKNEEITSPVTVEYGKNKTLTIITNPGFDVDTVTVDGADYELDGGKVEIKNVQNDVNVEVSFKLKEYKIKVDGNEYNVAHNTSYSELLDIISPEKKGYNFIGLEDKNGNLISSTYVVKGNDELTTKYERKNYKITLIVGKDGKVYDSSNNEITSPITVSYEDDYTLKVVANEGYDVKEVIVDGVSYKLTDGKVEIKNVQKDIEVVVNFKLKEYIITVDGTEYKVARGTSYEDLIKQINITKKGYLFKGIKDSNGKLLDKNYVVDGDDKLEIIFEKDPLVEVPGTGDNIIGYIMIFISALIALLVFFITRKKNCKN